jgi:hypothetical protein
MTKASDSDKRRCTLALGLDQCVLPFATDLLLEID